MSSGMFFESVRTLITNELQVPTLHGLDAKDGARPTCRSSCHLLGCSNAYSMRSDLLQEIKAAFKQVDEKTGCCGIIDPHEVPCLLTDRFQVTPPWLLLP